MASGPEFDLVEKPFVDQLVSTGWRHIAADLDDPSVTGRETFREVFLLDDLRQALHRVNLDPHGNEWLDDDRTTQAINALQRPGAVKLLEANQITTERLVKGTVVDGVEGWDQGRGRTVHFIDWDHPENNVFRVINQFRVDEPGGQAKKFIAPDVVLFVNGIPVVVVECKSPGTPEPIEQAVDQLQRYANQREWVEGNEGSERLFHANQFVVATSYDEARVATFTAQAGHFLEWKDTSPRAMSEVAKALGKEKLSSQETLVAGMLEPAHLLDLIRHFTLFAVIEGRTVKIICRYQQFRTVQLAVQRMLTGKTREQDGEHDRRGGIIWHTQGSGKSLTMVFLVRKMRSDPDLRRFKIVLVTDRKDLQDQLARTAVLTDETLTIVKPERRGPRTVSSLEVLKETLSRPGKDLVFAMIQKYRGGKVDEYGDEVELEDGFADDGPAVTEPLPTLNDSEAILVMVDEAHRSHGSALHANLLRTMPNCVRLGFTGTPIIMGAKKRTHDIFGEFVDRYTIKQSEIDGATIPILYEGRTSEGAVKGGGRLDEVFEDMFVDRTPEELEAIKAKYATKGHVMEAPELIAAKARNMLSHYVENILPNGFKAQVVAVSRRATICYHEAFKAAQDALVAELETLDPNLLELTDDQVERLEDDQAFLLRAHRFLPLVRALKFAPVISGGNNDDPAWKEWTERSKIDDRIARFKRRLPDDPGHYDPKKADPLAFLIVKSMLITGFDAPVEQVMYLDRHIKEAELLQAIARVNRTYGEKKKAGIVVDYYGVARHLKEALAVYSAEDVEGALQSLKDEIPKLRDRHRRVTDLFTSRDIDDISSTEACVELLRDERLRAEFQVKLKQFLATLDLVLPRPEALSYVGDAKMLSFIQARARNRYRSGERLIGKEVGEKVRKLIDDHIISLGIDPKIPPISLTDNDFDEHVEQEGSARAKASEMEHALRYHISKHLDEDPVRYQQLSERLKGILEDLEGQWEVLVTELKALVDEAKEARQPDDTGLDPETQAPFFDLLRQEVERDGPAGEEKLARLRDVTVELVDHIQQEILLVGFWRNPHAQDVLHKWTVQFLDDQGDVVPFDRLGAVADRLVELAKANHHKLVRG